MPFRAVQDIRVAENAAHAQFVLVFQVRTRTPAEYDGADAVFAALQQIGYIELGGRMRNGGIPREFSVDERIQAAVGAVEIQIIPPRFFRKVKPRFVYAAGVLPVDVGRVVRERIGDV